MATIFWVWDISNSPQVQWFIVDRANKDHYKK